MPSRKSILTVVLTLTVLAGGRSAEAQSGGDALGGSGNLCVQSAPSTDASLSDGFNFEFLTRIRVGMFPGFSWGRGAVGNSGLLRSSTAVLRERRGLKLR